MSLLTHLRIGCRLGLAFTLCIALTVLLAFFARSTLGRINKELELMVTDRMVKVALFSQLKDNFQTIGRYARNTVINTDPAFVDGEKKKIAELRAQNGEILSQLDKIIVLPAGRELLKVIVQERPPYNAAMDRAIEMASKGETAAAGAYLIGEVRQRQNVVFKATDDSIRLQRDIANDLAKKATEASAASVKLMAGLAFQPDVDAQGITFAAAPEYDVFPTLGRWLKPYEAVERAIHKSSPLPKPDRPELFMRELTLRFRPLT